MTTTAATPLALFMWGATDQRTTPAPQRDRDWNERGLTAWLTALALKWLDRKETV